MTVNMKHGDMPVMVKRSNELIKSYENFTLTVKKLIAMAIAAKEDVDGELVASISVKEMKNKLGISGNHIYDELKVLSCNVLKYQCMIDDLDKGVFECINVFQYATGSESGPYWKFYFSNKIRPHLSKLNTRWTQIELNALMSFKFVYTFRLFELFKTEEFKLNKNNNFTYIHCFDLVDLRFALGLINFNSDYVRESLTKGVDKKEIYETILENSEWQRKQTAEHRKWKKEKNVNGIKEEKADVRYPRWIDMRNKVLDPAVEEINASPYSPFTVTYNAIRKGKGGGVKEIEFIVTKKESAKETPVLSNDFQCEYVDEVRSMISEPLNDNDIKAILKAADNDIDQIRAAYVAACGSATTIRNLAGWMVRAIQDGWSNTAPVRKKRTNGFNNAPERDRDMDELELFLLRTN